MLFIEKLKLYDESAGFLLKGLMVEEWEEIYQKAIIFNNHIIRLTQEYVRKYKKMACDKHFGLCVNVNKIDDTVKREWIRLLNPDDMNSRWVWYKQWKDGYVPKFSIIT